MPASLKLMLACLVGLLVLAHGEAEAKKTPVARGPTSAGPHIEFGEPRLAPFAHTTFCIHYKRDCEAAGRGDTEYPTAPSRSALDEIAKINAEVNARIAPERNTEGVAGEKWLLFPARGDCNDYAVSKRHALLARGWPSRSLLLAEVVTTWGEHHLVLVMRSEGGDVVLDNLTDAIVPWTRTSYQWLRIQSPHDPRFWLAVRDGGNDLRLVASNERRPVKPQKRAHAERRQPRLDLPGLKEASSQDARRIAVDAFAGKDAKHGRQPLATEVGEAAAEQAPADIRLGIGAPAGGSAPFDLDEPA